MAELKPKPQKKTRGEAEVRPPMDDVRRARILEQLGLVIAEKRKSAIDGRSNSGIEEDWQESQDAYDGVDDANRHEFRERQTKPTEGGRSTEVKPPKGSTLLPNIVAPHVDAGAAKISDMVMPGGDERNFAIESTPVPDVIDEEEGWPAIEPEPVLAGAAAVQPGMPPGAPQPPNAAAQIMMDPAQAAQPPADPLKDLLDKLQAIKKKADEQAERMQKKVDDHLVECNWDDELRKIIDDSARLGTGAVEGPVPEKQKSQVWAKNPRTGEYELIVKQKTVPVSRRVSVWDCFPDFPACGDDIHSGSFFFRRRYRTGRMMRQLKGGKGAAAYIDTQIDKVLKEGPSKKYATASHGFEQMAADKDVYEDWAYYGWLTGEEMEACGCEVEDPDKQYPAIVNLVNDTVIKASLNHLDTGAFPFDFVVWKARDGMPWGAGVARQGRTPQRMTTAALRMMLDNAGEAAKPHKVISQWLSQVEGNPWLWEPDSDMAGSDMRTAMQFFVQPMLQGDYAAIIALGEKMMEVATGLPMIILGMQGNIEETAHGRALQNNNGSTVLRRIARNIDAMTKRHIRRYDEWIKMYSDDETLKGGDFQIRARASSALVERDLQNQQLPTIMQMSLNQAFEMDPKLARDEYLKSQHFDPKAFDLTEERKKELASRQQQPPPQIAVAEINAKNRLDLKQMELQHDMQDSGLERELKTRLAQLDAQLATAELAEDRRQALDAHRVQLASLVMTLRDERDARTQLPPTEPAGRAPAGQAFSQ